MVKRDIKYICIGAALKLFCFLNIYRIVKNQFIDKIAAFVAKRSFK